MEINDHADLLAVAKRLLGKMIRVLMSMLMAGGQINVLLDAVFDRRR